MIKIQIVDDERLLNYADFDGCEVWLLNTPKGTVDERCIIAREVTDSLLSNREKFPALMTEIISRHPPVSRTAVVSEPVLDEEHRPVFDEHGNVKTVDVEREVNEVAFDYEVLTRDREGFSTKIYVCDSQKIHEVKVQD